MDKNKVNAEANAADRELTPAETQEALSLLQSATKVRWIESTAPHTRRHYIVAPEEFAEMSQDQFEKIQETLTLLNGAKDKDAVVWIKQEGKEEEVEKILGKGREATDGGNTNVSPLTDDRRYAYLSQDQAPIALNPIRYSTLVNLKEYVQELGEAPGFTVQPQGAQASPIVGGKSAFIG